MVLYKLKYKIEATIPTTEYGNLRPSFEIESSQDEGVALDTLKHLWQRFGESPLKDKTGGGVKMHTFTGEEVVYDDASHTYYDTSGRILMSGSAYAATKVKPFDKDNVAAAAAKSWEVNSKDLIDLWEINSKISTEYGSAIHTALETYHRYKVLGEIVQVKKKTDYNYALPKIPFVREAVMAFEQNFGIEGMVEVLVSDVSNARAGRIDRLRVLDSEKKVCAIDDFKTNFELDEKKIAQYQHQLSFYAAILKAHGWTVKELNIFHFSDGWSAIPLEVLQVS